MKLAFRMAWKFLSSSKGQTSLIIVGIAVGISIQLFIGLLIQGLQLDLIDKTIGKASHVTINKEEYFDYDMNFQNQLLDYDEITKVSPVLQTNAFLLTNDSENTVQILGVQNDDIYRIEEILIDGKMPEDNQVIIGSFYTDINVGDSIQITSISHGSVELEVIGKYESGVSEVDERIVYTTLETLQGYMNLDGKVSMVETQIKDIFESKKVSNQLSSDLMGFNVENWETQNADLLSALSSQSVSSYIIQVAVVVSVALAISSVLIISVVQKSKQIGILKAMGLTNSGIGQVFMSQGLILGVIGSVLGVAFGILLLVSFTTFAVDESGEAVINIVYNPVSIAISLLIGIVSAFVASLIPARKSRKLTTIEVINNG